jgi:hypothetical protein
MMDEGELAQSEVIEAWQCIGCGRIEAPQPCIGICQDQKVRLVDAASYEDALARLRESQREAAALEGLIRRLAATRPRPGEWERSYKTFQDQAQRAISRLSFARSSVGAPPPAAPHPEPPTRDRRQ